MHDQPIPAQQPDGRSVAARDDDAVELAVIVHLVHMHPTQLTVEETVRELADGSILGADPDGVQEAIRSLTRVGLLRTHGACVVPTRPALRLVALWF